MENQLDTQKRKWIYIIKRNGMVYELLLGDESYQSLFKSWNRKEHIMVKDLNNEPIGVNAVDIVDILPENQYSNFIETLAPTKNYIVKGVWYDRKEKRQVRVEPWKKLELDEAKKIEQKKVDDYAKEANMPNSSLQKKIKRVGDEMRKSGVLPPKK